MRDGIPLAKRGRRIVVNPMGQEIEDVENGAGDDMVDIDH